MKKGGTDTTIQVPAEGNFLIAHSTMPGRQSYKLKGEGGIFGWQLLWSRNFTPVRNQSKTF